MKSITYRPVVLLIILCFTLIAISGCKSKKADSTKTSMGVDDGIEGFLFNFDQREVVKQLVNYQKKGKYPTSVTWFYKRGGPERKSEKFIDRMAVTSTDPDFIETIYYALSNSIILGTSSEPGETPTAFISFTLEDGEECRFDFINEITIRQGDHNYVAEADGSLWSSLTRDDWEIITEAASESASEEEPEEEITETAAEPAGGDHTSQIIVGLS